MSGFGYDAVARVQAGRLFANSVLYNAQALTAWHAALSNRENAPAKILVVGDSITEGASASSYAKRWVSRFRDRIRTLCPTSGIGAGGGLNNLPPYTSGGAIAQGVPYTSFAGSAPGNDATFGLGSRTSVYGTVAQGPTFTFTGTSFRLHFTAGPSLGVANISVDGGAAATFDTSGTLGAIKGYDSGALSAGSHTVAITKASGGSVYFSGILTFNGDENKGIQVYEAGHYGWRATDWLFPSQTFFNAPIIDILPHAVIISLIENDYQSQTALATYKSNIQTIISRLRAGLTAYPPSIILMIYSRRGDVASPQPITWEAYVQTLYDIVDQDNGGIGGASGLSLIDLTKKLPVAAASGTVDPFGVFNGDRVHYTDKGHGLIGDEVARVLT